MLDPDDAEKLLTHLVTYQYASAEHVTLTLLWRTMMRRGAALGLNVDDYHPEDQCLEIVHRPASDTPTRTANAGSDWSRSRRKRATCSTTQAADQHIDAEERREQLDSYLERSNE